MVLVKCEGKEQTFINTTKCILSLIILVDSLRNCYNYVVFATSKLIIHGKNVNFAFTNSDNPTETEFGRLTTTKSLLGGCKNKNLDGL